MTWNELATRIRKMTKEARKGPVKVAYPNSDDSREEPVISQEVAWGTDQPDAEALLSVDPPC